MIEDRFPSGRPAWETVGAQIVADVAPYEFMKLRLLNGSHLAVAGLGRLMGYTTIDEAMADPLLSRYMAALMDRETGPTVPPVPGIDLAAYKAKLVERFANPAIKDTVERVNTDAPINVLLDPIRDRLAQGAPLDLLALALAAWLRRVRGEDEIGAPIDIKHPLAATLRETRHRRRPRSGSAAGPAPAFRRLRHRPGAAHPGRPLPRRPLRPRRPQDPGRGRGTAAILTGGASMSHKILVLYGSYRSDRQGIRLADYLVGAFAARGASPELIDAKALNLPMLDRMYKEYPNGAAPPALETLAEKIRAADAFVFVTGEYNWSVQPGLKNLTDHFLEEWFWRPAAIASYSSGRFAGVRSALAWHGILSEMGMVVISSALSVGNIGQALDGASTPTGDAGAALTRAFPRFADDLAWWTDAALTHRARAAPPY